MTRRQGRFKSLPAGGPVKYQGEGHRWACYQERCSGAVRTGACHYRTHAGVGGLHAGGVQGVWELGEQGGAELRGALSARLRIGTLSSTSGKRHLAVVSLPSFRLGGRQHRAVEQWGCPFQKHLLCVSWPWPASSRSRRGRWAGAVVQLSLPSSERVPQRAALWLTHFSIRPF